MNYNRRSKRPDAGYYRETRKVKRSGGGGRRGGGRGIPPIAMLGVVIVMAVLVWFIFLRR
jgi:hypothetical protein